MTNMALSYKLNFCRITVASKLFVRNNYFPLFRVLTPQDATREIIKNSFTPKNHYMPVLHSSKKRDRLSRGKRLKDLKNYGKRLHSKIDEFKYMTVSFAASDDKHAKLLELLGSKRRVRGGFVYKIEERNTCLVFDGQLEEAARNGDIADVTIADNTNKMIMRLKTGEKLTAEAKELPEEGRAGKLYEGEAATTKDEESRHHYGRTIMNIAHIFEMKEKCAALYELEKIQFEAKRKERTEKEWKDGMESLLGNLAWERQHTGKESAGSESQDDVERAAVRMAIRDVSTTARVSDKVANGDLVHKLPLIREVNRMVRRLGEGRFVELEDTTGVLLKMGDIERFIVGQIVETDKERMFVPGQTFETAAGVKYMPGITVNLDNTPTFVAGLIFADDANNGVFLPGQSVITGEGLLKLPREGERITPVGMRKMQMTEDEQWARVERRKLAKERSDKERSDKRQLERKRLKREGRKRAEAARLERERTDDVATAGPTEERHTDRIKTAAIPIPVVTGDVIEHGRNIGDEETEKVCTKQERITGFSVSVEADDKLVRHSGTESVGKQTEAGVAIPADSSPTEPSAAEPMGDNGEQSETLRAFNEEIYKGIFLQDHSHLVDEETIDRDREMIKAKCIQVKHEEERKRNAQVADNMKDVIEALEIKKTKLLEKLRNIQNETAVYQDEAVTYIYPAKANAIAIELGFDGRAARNIAKILLGITRWANTYSAKFHVHFENIHLVSYSDEIDDGFNNCSDALKSVLKTAMVAAVEVFKVRPQDLEGGLRAAAHIITEAAAAGFEAILEEIASIMDNRTNSERNVIFSSALKDLTKKIVVNKAETLRSIIREEYCAEKMVAKVNLVIEEEGDILVRAFTNLTHENEALTGKVYSSIVNTAAALVCEDSAGEVAHRAIVNSVQEIYDDRLDKFLKTESTHSIRHLLMEAMSLSDIIGMKNESKTIDRLLGGDDNCLSVHVLATDQITLDVLRRAMIMRHLADRDPYLKTGLGILRRDRRKSAAAAADDKNVRELVRESAALMSHACPILTSLDIPSFLFELGNSMAMEDFLVQRIKKDGALLISKKGVQAVVPKEASRFVLSGLVSYTLIDDKGLTYFKPMHVFNALKLGKQKEKLYHDYSCVGAFDKYAYSVPVRESLQYNHRNYEAHSLCRDDVCCAGGGAAGDWGCCWHQHVEDTGREGRRQQHSGGPSAASPQHQRNMSGLAVALAGPRA